MNTGGWLQWNLPLFNKRADFTSNGSYTLIHCGGYNGPMIGHRTEKCKKVGIGYEDTLAQRFEREFEELRNCK